MPNVLPPSNVFPFLSGLPPATTESKSAYAPPPVSSYVQPSPRRYRGSSASRPASASVLAQPDEVMEQIDDLKRRLETLKVPSEAQKALSELTARVSALEASTASTAPKAPPSVPADTVTYDSFAKYAGEASRVAAAGRLPFGSDHKKMNV